jgi:phosphatidylserine decarboxylase
VNLGKKMPIGHRFGMIKFGSRTELIIPAEGAEIVVNVGDVVRGGKTTVARIINVNE